MHRPLEFCMTIIVNFKKMLFECIYAGEHSYKLQVDRKLLFYIHLSTFQRETEINLLVNIARGGIRGLISWGTKTKTNLLYLQILFKEGSLVTSWILVFETWSDFLTMFIDSSSNTWLIKGKEWICYMKYLFSRVRLLHSVPIYLFSEQI